MDPNPSQTRLRHKAPPVQITAQKHSSSSRPLQLVPPLILGWGILSLAINVGCSKRITPVELGDKQQILFIANGTEPNELDPHLVNGVVEQKILQGLFEGLLSPDPKTLEPRPGVAERWEISQDQRTYTFFLRENARWTNGDPLTSHDFVYSYQRILSPNLAAEYAYMLYPLKNAEPYHQGKVTDFDHVGVTALDDHTLELELEAPLSYFLSLILHFSWYPLHPPSIAKHGAIDQRNTHWTRAEKLISNGAFELKDWRLWDAVVVRKNPFYWDQANVRLQEIHFLPIDNAHTEERAFRAGQVHITESLPKPKVQAYKEKASPFLRIDPYLGVYYYLLNTTQPPLDDIRVRCALSLTVDRRAIVDNITRGGEQAALNFTPPETGGYTPPHSFKEDTAKAQHLLAQAGYPNGQDFPTLELLYNTSETHKIIAEAIQQMWKEKLNIDVRLINQDWKVYLAARRSKDYQIARASWVGDYNDPNTFLDLWTSYSGNNHSGWNKRDYDHLIKQAGRTLDPRRRHELFQEAENLLISEHPMIPIYFYKKVYLIDPSVKNWHSNILDWHPYKYVYLDSSSSENATTDVP